MSIWRTERSTEREAKAAHFFEPAVIVAAVFVIPAIALHDPELGRTANTIGLWLDAAIWLVFASELAVMLSVTPDRKKWLRNNYFSPLIVILTPPFAYTLFSALRILRIFQLFRLMRAVRVMKRLFSVEGLRFAAMVAVGSILIGGVAFAIVEEGNGLSPTDGMWWAVTTVTTVGYGDIHPETDAGRIIAITVMGVGIGFVALVTGATAERFLNTSTRAETLDERRDQILHELKELRADVAELKERQPDTQLLERDRAGP